MEQPNEQTTTRVDLDQLIQIISDQVSQSVKELIGDRTTNQFESVKLSDSAGRIVELESSYKSIDDLLKMAHQSLDKLNSNRDVGSPTYTD